MRAEDLSIEVRDNNLVRQGQIDLDDIEKLEIIKRFCNVGSWDLVLPAESESATKLKQHRGIVVTGRVLFKTLISPEISTPFKPAEFSYVPNDIVLMSGRVDKMLTEQDSEDLDGMIKFVGFDDNIHLGDALAWPQPGNDNPSTQTSSHDVRTGTAEDLVRQYVSFNIGPGSTPSRRISGLVLETSSLGRGAMVTGRARFDQLGKLLGQIALEGGIGFDLAHDLSADTIVTKIYVPTDKSNTVRMSIENDDLSSAKFGMQAPRATRAIVAGQGEGTGRVIIQRTTAEAAAAEAEWGRKIEVFKDRRDTDQLAELQAEGDVLITENGVTIKSLSVVPADDIPAVYARDWFLGDIVGVDVAGQNLTAKVTESIIRLDSDGLKIGATVGDPVGFDWEAQLISKQKDQEQRLAFLEKNAEKSETIPWSSITEVPGRIGSVNNLGPGVDPDTLTDTGWYSGYNWIGSLAGESIGTLEVIQYSPDWIVQYFTTAAASPVVRVRARYSGTTWGAWNVVSQAGHTHSAAEVTTGTLSNIILPGRIQQNASFANNLHTSWDTVVDSGFYVGSNLANKPNADDWHYVTVTCHYSGSGYVEQRATSFRDATTVGAYPTFVRVREEDVWGPWQRVAYAGTLGTPFAMAAGIGTITLSAANFASVAVTFPAGRFSQIPRITMTQSSLPGSSQKLIAKYTNASATGFNAYFYTGDGTALTVTANFDYIAVQMLSTNGTG